MHEPGLTLPVAAAVDDVDKDTAVPSTILRRKAERPTPPRTDPLRELLDLPYNKAGVFGSSADTPAYRDVAKATERDEEPVLVQLKSFVPIRGKTAFTVYHMMSAPLKALRERVIAQEGFPRRPITLHLDSSDPLDESKSLVELGFRFPPLLSIQGFDYELTVRTIGVDMTITLPWRVHLTTTDLVRDVFRRLQPRDLRLTRFTIIGGPPGTPVGRVLDTARCFAYPADSSVPPSATLKDLKLAYHDEDPVTIHFVRTKEGQPLSFELRRLTNGRTTVAEIRDAMLQLEQLGELDRCLVDMTDENVALVHSCCPFDDDDEEIAPEGVKRVYFRGSERHATFSFNPPAEDCAFVTPRFVTIEDDFSIPHLADQGVVPGAVVLLEHFNPHTKTWSGETEAVLREELRQHESNNGVELLTVKTHRGALLRVPVTPMSTMETVQHRVWCVTGDLPMFSILQTDAGRLLMTHETLVSAQLFPQATIHSVPRPRLWLGENAELALPPRDTTLLLSIREPDVIAAAQAH